MINYKDSRLGLMKDEVVKKIFSGETDISKRLIAYVIDEVTNHRYGEEFIYNNMEILNSDISSSINTSNIDTDRMFKIKGLYVNLEFNTSHSRRNDNKNNIYICNIVIKNINTKEDYDNINNVIQINFDYYDLYRKNKFLYNSILMEKDIHIIRPNNFIEIIDINLAYLKKFEYTNIYKETEHQDLIKRLYFLIKNDELTLENIYKDDILMKEVIKEVERVTRNMDELFYYNRASMEEAAEKEYWEEVRKETREHTQKEMIKSMLNEKIDIKIISKISNMSIDQIKEIEKSLKD